MQDYRIDFVNSQDFCVGSISFTATAIAAGERIRATDGAFLRRRIYRAGQLILDDPSSRFSCPERLT